MDQSFYIKIYGQDTGRHGKGCEPCSKPLFDICLFIKSWSNNNDLIKRKQYFFISTLVPFVQKRKQNSVLYAAQTRLTFVNPIRQLPTSHPRHPGDLCVPRLPGLYEWMRDGWFYGMGRWVDFVGGILG